MIQVTRLNGKLFSLNALYIEQVEEFPDTTITLSNGDKFIVKESLEEVVKRITNFYREINIVATRKDMEG
ncbi:flagellar FlbD family protein [Priestia koreensis]|uniref:Flagellar protein FlbD n=1 Tax=Priestia koreensis TaxID=284581 RepID=A0A0M0L6J4_9BACI|nr:flagellar FlbD family protein [Priestia koreensis]KOO46700.1 hypothetical protein AMD01_12375 [Priestia koreensis]MCM3003766.1 flagellar FlbD family protein [Priestia koreensis]UNL87318.1 flagellar FlbD family protein [Priestia koreensis]